jgi:hypothetical protein
MINNNKAKRMFIACVHPGALGRYDVRWKKAQFFYSWDFVFDRKSPSFTSSHVTVPRRGPTSWHWPWAVNQNSGCVHQVQGGTLITLISHTYRHSCAFSPDLCPLWSYSQLSNFTPNPDLSHVIHFQHDESQNVPQERRLLFFILEGGQTSRLL